MPSFEFFTTQEAGALIAFTQARTGKLAKIRSDHQLNMKQFIVAENNLSSTLQLDYQIGYPGADPLTNLMMVERGYWFEENPLPVTRENLLRGREIFRERCIGCHGVNGDGAGVALGFLNPAPVGFIISDTARYGSDTSPGAYYWRILRGVPGTAMENFGTRLSVEDIWRVVLFLKTIPNGGLQKTPTPEMYVEWTGYPELFRWASCFYPENMAIDNPQVTYDGNSPPGIGDVAAIVDEGTVNPEYAVVLYMLENKTIPCGAQDPDVSVLDIVTAAENRPTVGYARMGTAQFQFVPPALLPADTYGQGWLTKVWSKPMPTQ
jgi:mono/diheme cytochrome c family protein